MYAGRMENHSPSPADTSPLGSRIHQLVHDTRGLLGILKSVKGLDKGGQDSQLYRITMKRFRDNCLYLAALSEAASLLLGEEARDAMLKSEGCRWDAGKSRVQLD